MMMDVSRVAELIRQASMELLARMREPIREYVKHGLLSGGEVSHQILCRAPIEPDTS